MLIKNIVCMPVATYFVTTILYTLVQTPATPVSPTTPRSLATLHTSSFAADQPVTECELMNLVI